MNTLIESLAYWRIHKAAADAAKARGACWLCCTKVGCNATDAPGEKPRRTTIIPNARPTRAQGGY